MSYPEYIDFIPEAPKIKCERCGFRTKILVTNYNNGDKDYDCDCGLPLARVRDGIFYEWENNIKHD